MYRVISCIFFLFVYFGYTQENPQRYPVNITLEEPEANLHPKLQIKYVDTVHRKLCKVNRF